MRYHIKYGVKALVQDKTIMFWNAIFPLILGTLFYFGLSNLSDVESFQLIPVAIVENQEENFVFEEFIKSVDGEIVEVQYAKETIALELLEENAVKGVFFVSEEPSLTILQNGIETSILGSVFESFLQGQKVVENIMREHPESLEKAMEVYMSTDTVVQEASIDGETMNFTLQFFYALIGMGCMYGAFLGMKVSINMQANLTPLAARRCVSPVHKLGVIVKDTTIAICIQWINSTILLCYLRYILDIGMENQWGYMLLTTYAGGVIGVSVGVFIGAIGKMSENTKTGIIIAESMVFCFLAGLMDSQMPLRVEQVAPIINDLNPVALITNSFYSLNTYNNMEAFYRNIIMMLIYSILLIVGSYFLVRREQYDSI